MQSTAGKPGEISISNRYNKYFTIKQKKEMESHLTQSSGEYGTMTWHVVASFLESYGIPR